MKKVCLALVLGLLLCNNQAQAGSFTLLPTDDATQYRGSLYNGWDLWPRHYKGEISYPLLKFTSSSGLQTALVNESISSINLELYAFSLYNNPDIKVYYSENDSWNETQGSMGIPIYTSDPIGEIFPLPEQYKFFSINLDITPFLKDDNDIYSLVLNNIDSKDLSNAQFTSKEYYDSVNPAEYFAPKLHIETKATVPEPASMLLFGTGLVGIFLRRESAV